MIKKIVFCLILLFCISPMAFAETSSDINATADNNKTVVDPFEKNSPLDIPTVAVLENKETVFVVPPSLTINLSTLDNNETTNNNISINRPYENGTITGTPILIKDDEICKLYSIDNDIKPLAENMVVHHSDVTYTGWELTYNKDIMNHNYQIHPLIKYIL